MMHVVTIVDSISETSMPVNEFVIYRARNKYELYQTIMVMDKKNDGIIIPNDVNVIYFNNSIIKLYGYVKNILKENKFNVIFHLHQPKSALMFYISSVFFNCWNRALFTVHSTFDDRNIKYKINSMLCAACSRKVICVSETAYMGYSSLIKSVKREVSYIRNGVDYERVNNVNNLLKYSLYPHDVNNLVYVARFVPVKNHIFLVKLMKELPNQRLFLVGEEDHEGSIRKIAREENVLDRIFFLGKIPREHVYEIIRKCDIYLSPSLVEGMPISVLEAMALGLNPILSDIAPHREIQRICTAISILPLEIKTWKEKILEIISYNKETLKYRSKIIKKHAKDNFSLENMNRKYIDVYRQMLKV